MTRLARRTFGGRPRVLAEEAAHYQARALDLFDPFGVPQNGQPVFDLPPGSTASSLALGIVDNVVPGPENPSSGVPAPASLLLVALGCVAAMGGRARRTPIGR